LKREKEMDKRELEQILERYNRSQGQIIAILHEIQDQERYLPEDDLRFVAEKLNMPLPQIYHIATFYKAFSLKPKGRHICNVCMGTACHVRGAPLVLEELERNWELKPEIPRRIWNIQSRRLTVWEPAPWDRLW